MQYVRYHSGCEQAVESSVSIAEQNQALKEELPTYSRHAVAIGGVAGVLIIIIPAMMFALYCLSVYLLDSFSGLSIMKVYSNIDSIKRYLYDVPLLCLICGIWGVFLAALRKHRGFAYHYVWRPLSLYRPKKGWSLYRLLGIIGFPVLLFTYLTSNRSPIADLLLYIPVLWFALGFPALVTWEWLQEKLLGLLSTSERNLEHEYIIKRLLGQDDDLVGSVVTSINVYKTRHIVIEGSFTRSTLKRIVDVIQTSLGYREEEVSIVNKCS